MNPDKRLAALPLLNKKYNLGLDIQGERVYIKGMLQTPFDLKKILDVVYPMAREEFLDELFLKHLSTDLEG